MRDPGAGKEGKVHGGGGGGEADAGHADHREASVRDKTTAGPSYAAGLSFVLRPWKPDRCEPQGADNIIRIDFVWF